MLQLSPVVAQHEFAARIRRQRELMGLAATEVSRQLGFSRNFYSAIENSRSVLAQSKLHVLLDLLGFGDADRRELQELYHAGRNAGWWHPFASSLDDAFVRYLGLEFGAAGIRSFEGRVFNGLLQSHAYARAVISASPNISRVDLERAHEVRMRRQQELFARDPLPRMTFLFSEAVLMQRFGDQEVLRQQMKHVLAVADRLGEGLEFRVQPFDVTLGGLSSASTLVLLEFESPFLPPVVYREAGTPIGASDDPKLVSKLGVYYDLAVAASTTHEESLRLIANRLAVL